LSLSAKNIADIRKDYQLAELNELMTGDDPIAFFHKWFAEAEISKADEINAMTLATVDKTGRPHARIVLLKGADEQGFTFFTNYNSAKGGQLDANPHVAIVFFWKELERQVRIEGQIEKLPGADSDAYFNSRPEASRLGAWASPQSTVINSRDVLDEHFAKYKQEFGSNIPRPSHWGGYRVRPELIEFWQGRSSRMHDRILFEKKQDNWKKSRLAP
jgi:pyridoxamine 5'-phosphate oxidase